MAYLVKVAACWVVIALAVSDLRFRRLPNLSVAALAALYCVHAFLAGSHAPELAAHAVAGGIAFAVAAVMWRFGWIAGGDAKLAAVVFWWAGLAHAAGVFFTVSVCGLVIGLAVLTAGAMLRRVAHAPLWLTSLAPSRGVPYGIALALGGLQAVWAPVTSMPHWPVA
ncbi:prepilin peptidase (plasmid) [Burkholderia humptydooensis]|uniref:Prepilin peptidase n=1 Tax=Burkholderia humptydooensis TaxID=430531 RepID=A0A7U4P7Z4_9BURK|nr:MULTISPECIES: prepilin peptidase [Burkholderia]AJY38056.1 type IV leader peptidase family protein [Burkholderia sp. 2002721687]ALX44577.1 hypothetical protein AQ610_18685 [Burkholderia humptydooensis]QPS42040.1 prepilin peptidase [Burkholderia humptydooensis]